MRPLRTTPITAITGLNGSGKTLLAVSWCMEHIKRGGRVLSNVAINHPQAVQLEAISQLDQARDCLVLLDEVTAWMPGRGWQAVPREVLACIAQLRKRNLQLIWTSPAWDDADTSLRRVTVNRVQCFPFIRTGWKAPLLVISTVYDSNQPGRPRFWQPRWSPGWKHYDTKTIITPAGAAGYCPECGLRIKPNKATCNCELEPPTITWPNEGPQHAVEAHNE